MTKEERATFKRLLAVAAQKEIMKAKHPFNTAIEQEWDAEVDKLIDQMAKLLGDDGR